MLDPAGWNVAGVPFGILDPESGNSKNGLPICPLTVAGTDPKLGVTDELNDTVDWLEVVDEFVF